MKHLLIALTSLALLLAAVGCSDDDNPVNGGTPTDTPTSTWNEAGQYWTTVVDGSSYDSFRGFSFTSMDTITAGVPKPFADVWDIAFRREVVKLNGGSSTDNSGDVEGADLGIIDFAGVTIADTTGAEWMDDEIEYFFDDWYVYTGAPDHELIPNGNVYSMTDATGDHYIKFQVDSMVGAGMPPNMGTVYMKYFFQDEIDSKNLNGTVVSVNFEVGSTPTYFDFSAGAVSTPADPATSLGWDLKFYAYDIAMNNDPTGSGECRGFYAYSELNEPADIEEFLVQPTAPMFPDIASSALTDWYDYQGPPTHQMLSFFNVYLIKTGDKVYKLKIDSYYANISGVPTSGHYTFVWKEL